MNSALSWTTSSSSSYPPYDIQTTALHEFGHWLSLGDTYLDGTVMLWIYDGSVRSLSQDDIDGINYIY
ncbi:matrixin family metalloprotease [Methanosarcina sp. WH1]|uniref:matrixin family metalloprotease n=1 Tax=Methanosarcina sp. WH1 TaxID=1434102 RepID=UPI00350EE568